MRTNITAKSLIALAMGLMNGCGGGVAQESNSEASESKSQINVVGGVTNSSGLIGSASTAFGELKIGVYGVWLSESEDCTDASLLYEADEPTTVDFFGSPALGQGPATPGTYHCVIIKMSDVIDLSISCNNISDLQLDNCVEPSTNTTSEDFDPNAGMTYDPDGNKHICEGKEADSMTGGVANPVWLYLTTGQTMSPEEALDSNGSSWIPPTLGNQHGMNLLSPLVVSSDSTATFIVDPVGGFGDTEVTCGFVSPTFDFKNQIVK